MTGLGKKIEVLGPGCKRCEALAKNARQAVAELGLAAQVDKVADINVMMRYGVMMTPALVVDGVVKSVGKVPSAEGIKALL